MIIKLNKNERELIMLISEACDLSNYLNSYKMIMDMRNNFFGDCIIMSITKQNIFDIYDMLIEYQKKKKLDDINLIELEAKLLKFIDDIQNDRNGWDYES